MRRANRDESRSKNPSMASFISREMLYLLFRVALGALDIQARLSKPHPAPHPGK